MKYYDFHSHILPGIDDGAMDCETSAQMLKTLKGQGVEHVILTPHYYPDVETAEEFYIRRDKALAELSEVYDRSCMPEFSVGAEVAVRPGVSKCDLEKASFCGKYIMLEMPPFYGEWILNEIEGIFLKGLRPVFAHIERPLMEYRQSDFIKLIDYKSCIYQVSVDALQDRKLRKFFIREFKNGGRFILGSDCHNMTTRPPDFDLKVLTARSLAGTFMTAVEENSKYILNKVGEENGNE